MSLLSLRLRRCARTALTVATAAWLMGCSGESADSPQSVPAPGGADVPTLGDLYAGAQDDQAVGTGADGQSGPDGSTPATDSGPGGAGPDTAGTDTAGTDGSAAASRCTLAKAALTCDHKTLTLKTSAMLEPLRDVHWQVPLGQAPSAGWPWVVVFQGSFFPAGQAWTATPDMVYGAFALVSTFAALLDAGYALLTPEAAWDGTTFWDTNVAPWNVAWSTSPDAALMTALFAAVEAGDFGPLDPKRRFAAGISSGGYMTSRMAVAYPGTFRALAIVAGSYATCAGALCAVPPLPADHPPTLFMHGELDTVVPLWTAKLYQQALDKQGTPTALIVDPKGGHGWPAAGPKAIVDFFAAHP